MTREEAINKWIIPAIKKTWNEKKCKEILEALEQEPKTGHWIEGLKDENGNREYFCSECGHSDIQAVSQRVPYCWWCGAKMESEE